MPPVGNEMFGKNDLSFSFVFSSLNIQSLATKFFQCVWLGDGIWIYMNEFPHFLLRLETGRTKNTNTKVLSPYRVPSPTFLWICSFSSPTSWLAASSKVLKVCEQQNNNTEHLSFMKVLLCFASYRQLRQ